jgi:hypothetical protein
MKKFLVAASVLAAVVSTPAWADGNNRNTDTETFTLRANNPAKCNLEATDYTLRIAGNSISDNDGFANDQVGLAVANELNSNGGVTAWCTGASNTLQMYRTPFTIEDGDQGDDGFNRAVVYDVALEIDGATRSDGTSPIEGTSDGQGNGPGVGVGGGLTVGRFGPSGTGADVTFSAETGSSSSAISNASIATAGATEGYQADNNRLIAGQYVSSLTIELTPGV